MSMLPNAAPKTVRSCGPAPMTHWATVNSPMPPPPCRLDSADKVNGKAQYGIDVRLPDMKVATVAACPVLGGKLDSVDTSKAMQVKGVRDVVQLSDAVAVIGDHMWAARQGLAALN